MNYSKILSKLLPGMILKLPLAEDLIYPTCNILARFMPNRAFSEKNLEINKKKVYNTKCARIKNKESEMSSKYMATNKISSDANHIHIKHTSKGYYVDLSRMFILTTNGVSIRIHG